MLTLHLHGVGRRWQTRRHELYEAAISLFMSFFCGYTHNLPIIMVGRDDDDDGGLLAA